MDKPYHLMTPSERIAARIAANRAIEQKIKDGTAATEAPRPRQKTREEFSRVGHAFLDSLPDLDKGTEARTLLKLGRKKI